MVVGVSCSVVGPKRYERWGVLFITFQQTHADATGGPESLLAWIWGCTHHGTHCTHTAAIFRNPRESLVFSLQEHEQ